MGREHPNFKGNNSVQFVTWNDTQEFIARLESNRRCLYLPLADRSRMGILLPRGHPTEYADELQWLACIATTRIKKSIRSGIFIRMPGVSTNARECH